MNLRTTMTFAIAADQIMEDDGLLQYKCNVGALITRIGFGGPLYYDSRSNKEP